MGLLLRGPGLGKLGSEVSIVLTSIPDHGGETQQGSNDGEDQCHNSLGSEFSRERIRTNIGTREVQTLIASSVTAVWDLESLAMVNVRLVNLENAGHDLGSLDDGRGKTGLEMPFDVAVEQPDTRVVGMEADGNILLRWDQDSVATSWVGGCEVTGIRS